MTTFLVGYDLNRPHQDYGGLIEAIKALGTWWHCLDSTWLVKSAASALSIANNLQGHIDDDDELLVVRLTGEAAWTGFGDECHDWLKKNL